MQHDSGSVPERDPWWADPPEAVLVRLGSGPEGLTGTEAQARLRHLGPNLLDGHRRKSAVTLAIAQIRSPLVLILALATLIAALVQSYADAAIILVILLLSAIMGFVQEYRTAHEVDDLLAHVRQTARVRRAGTEVLIPASEVVPGDILLLNPGDLIAADARLLSCESLFTVEAPLTGEPFPVEKLPALVAASAALPERTCAVWTGTSVRSGTGEAVAVVTGRASVFGAIAEGLERREGETAFTLGIRRFGIVLSEVMLVIVLIVFAANSWLGRPFFDSLTFALALAVGLTPQMLPAILSVTLASGARALAKGGVIVKRLSSIENLGSMDVLCTDKTGTLTEGTVTLARATGPDGADDSHVLSYAVLNARLQRGTVNALDAALLAEGARIALPAPEVEKLGEVPYDFLRRRVSIVVGLGENAQIVTKGAALSVLEDCTEVAGRPLEPEDRARFTSLVEGWSKDGTRVLALASRVLPRQVAYGSGDERGLQFEGFLLFADPLRSDAAATVKALRSLGVSVRIITGDNRFVALHVAKAVGLTHARAVTGEQIATLGADALARLATRTQVFAEIDPAGKERIISALRAAGHVTGYMGDGINDATALRLADIGLSVNGAVDVARDAADMILTSPDLGTLINGIDEGRRAFANTQKYLHIATAASFGNMASMAAASIILPFLPQTAGLILLNNLLSDFPMLALCSDSVDREARSRPHRWRAEDLVRFMAVFGLISSAFDLLTFWLLLAVFAAPPTLFHTAWFIESLLTELVFTLVIRTSGPVWQSRPSNLLISLSVGVAVLAVALPLLPGASYLGLAPLSLDLAALMAGLAVAYGVVTEIVKRKGTQRPRP